ncbi:hypothetical protein Tco_0381475 [Tanacetum coccineum]
MSSLAIDFYSRTVLGELQPKAEGKLAILEQPLPPNPAPKEPVVVRDAYFMLFNAQKEVACLMLVSMTPDVRKELVTSLIHIESRKSPTAELFDVDSGRISIVTVNTKEHHSDVLAKSQGYCVGLFVITCVLDVEQSSVYQEMCPNEIYRLISWL